MLFVFQLEFSSITIVLHAYVILELFPFCVCMLLNVDVLCFLKYYIVSLLPESLKQSCDN